MSVSQSRGAARRIKKRYGSPAKRDGGEINTKKPMKTGKKKMSLRMNYGRRFNSSVVTCTVPSLGGFYDGYNGKKRDPIMLEKSQMRSREKAKFYNPAHPKPVTLPHVSMLDKKEP